MRRIFYRVAVCIEEEGGGTIGRPGEAGVVVQSWNISGPGGSRGATSCTQIKAKPAFAVVSKKKAGFALSVFMPQAQSRIQAMEGFKASFRGYASPGLHKLYFLCL